MTDTSEKQWIPINVAHPEPHLAIEILDGGVERLARMRLGRPISFGDNCPPCPAMSFHWFDEKGRRCTQWASTDGGSVTHWRDPQ